VQICGATSEKLDAAWHFSAFCNSLSLWEKLGILVKGLVVYENYSKRRVVAEQILQVNKKKTRAISSIGVLCVTTVSLVANCSVQIVAPILLVNVILLGHMDRRSSAPNPEGHNC
jgi:hypothetical protein